VANCQLIRRSVDSVGIRIAVSRSGGITVAVIVGVTSGIGLATAKRFVEEGAYVWLTGRRQAERCCKEKITGALREGVWY
jgi:short chain dehydrogenase